MKEKEILTTSKTGRVIEDYKTALAEYDKLYKMANDLIESHKKEIARLNSIIDELNTALFAEREENKQRAVA